MLNCLYKGKRINAITVVEESNYEYRKEIKLAGARKELICEDCNAPMFLRVCKHKESHFAHWRGFGEQCTYYDYSAKETEQHKKCKRILYNYFKGLYPDASIELEYKAVLNRRSDLYIEFTDGNKLAVDIQRNSLSALKWDDKHNDYKNAGITDIWIIMGQPSSDTERTMHFFQQIMLNESMDGTAIFINTDNEEITLVKKIAYKKDEKTKWYDELFQRTYKLSEIVILPNGKIDSTFQHDYILVEAQLKNRFEEEQLSKQRQQSVFYKNTQHENTKAPLSEQISWGIGENKTAVKKASTSEWYQKFRNLPNANVKSSIQQKNNYESHSFDKTKITGIMRAYITRVTRGEKGYLDKLIKMMHEGPDYYHAFMEIYAEMKNIHNESGADTCRQVLIKSGMD